MVYDPELATGHLRGNDSVVEFPPSSRLAADAPHIHGPWLSNQGDADIEPATVARARRPVDLAGCKPSPFDEVFDVALIPAVRRSRSVTMVTDELSRIATPLRQARQGERRRRDGRPEYGGSPTRLAALRYGSATPEDQRPGYVPARQSHTELAGRRRRKLPTSSASPSPPGPAPSPSTSPTPGTSR